MRPQTEKRMRVEEKILHTLHRSKASFTTRDLIWILEGTCSKSSVYGRVDVLEARGMIKYMGKGKKSRSAQWMITGKGKGVLR